MEPQPLKQSQIPGIIRPTQIPLLLLLLGGLRTTYGWRLLEMPPLPHSLLELQVGILVISWTRLHQEALRLTWQVPTSKQLPPVKTLENLLMRGISDIGQPQQLLSVLLLDHPRHQLAFPLHFPLVHLFLSLHHLVFLPVLHPVQALVCHLVYQSQEAPVYRCLPLPVARYPLPLHHLKARPVHHHYPQVPVSPDHLVFLFRYHPLPQSLAHLLPLNLLPLVLVFLKVDLLRYHPRPLSPEVPALPLALQVV